MADRTWETLTLPVLEKVADAEAVGRDLSMEELSRDLGAPPSAIGAELVRLLNGEYITGEIEEEMGNRAMLEISEPVLLERGARAVGKWPSDDPYEALLALLDARIESATDDDTRSRLRRFRDNVRDVGKGALGGVLGALIRDMAGLP